MGGAELNDGCCFGGSERVDDCGGAFDGEREPAFDAFFVGGGGRGGDFEGGDERLEGGEGGGGDWRCHGGGDLVQGSTCVEK